MNVNNQSSSSLKQVKIQMPISALNILTKCINELVTMYPKDGEDKMDYFDYEIKS